MKSVKIKELPHSDKNMEAENKYFFLGSLNLKKFQVTTKPGLGPLLSDHYKIPFLTFPSYNGTFLVKG